MREVEVARFVPVPPATVRRTLSPPAIVEYEGSFDVREVTETEDGWLVTAGASGLQMTLAFEADDRRRSTVYVYRQRGDAGPFESMETTLSVRAEDEGSRVTMRSAVSLGLPVGALTDRVAAWKRRGELKRALDRLAADLS